MFLAIACSLRRPDRSGGCGLIGYTESEEFFFSFFSVGKCLLNIRMEAPLVVI